VPEKCCDRVDRKSPAGPQSVRIVTWAFGLWCIGFLYWGADLSQTYGLAPGDGGVLGPPLQRWTAAAILALIGILPFAGMLIYARLYVIRLAREGANVNVTVIGLFAPSTRIYAVTDIEHARHHHGRLKLRISVNAPWITLRIAGRPYVIDLQAERIDASAIEKLVADAARAQHQPKKRKPDDGSAPETQTAID
jgi:hypothetical protein